MNRRERLRHEMMATLSKVGAEELRRVGAASLSLREVAERAGISPAGLYRYVDGRDELLELLIADAFDDLAAVVGEAIGSDDVDDRGRIQALMAAYRQWALAEPARFALILGTPVVGFAASQEGPTRPAARRFGAVMLQPFVDAYGRGALADVPVASEPGAASSETGAGAEAVDQELPGGGVLPMGSLARILRTWAAVHGLVVLELDQQLDWSGLDVGDLVSAEVDALADDLLPTNRSG